MMEAANDFAPRQLPARRPHDRSDADTYPPLSIRINNLMRAFHAGLINFDQWAAATSHMLSACRSCGPARTARSAPFEAAKPKRAVFSQTQHVIST